MEEFEKFRPFRFRIYIAGPYSGRHKPDDPDIPSEINKNINKSRETAMKLAEMGYAWLSPHLNSCHFENDCRLPHTHESYLPPDFNWISCCDALILTEGWEGSYGTAQEIAYAKYLGILIFETLIDLDRYFSWLKSCHPNVPNYLQDAREGDEIAFRTWCNEYKKLWDNWVAKHVLTIPESSQVKI